MKLLALLILLILAQPALAQDVDFRVLRGDCAGGPEDLNAVSEIQSVWLADGTLEITAWGTETQERAVVDGSASLDASRPGIIRLIYQSKFTPLPPDAPVLMCEDFAKLIFLVRDLERSDYEITIEESQVVLRSVVKG
ncbi:hypothetical protein WCE34_14270 [Luteimonas sp. MJ204]|uniref:hypothetical protein n=1 Tax=Luteimonas sp. MJ145 TaxID=3129234 RepID=UPI0031BB4AE0